MTAAGAKCLRPLPDPRRDGLWQRAPLRVRDGPVAGQPAVGIDSTVTPRMSSQLVPGALTRRIITCPQS